MRFLLIFCVSFFAFFSEISAKDFFANAYEIENLLENSCEKAGDLNACYYFGLIEFAKNKGRYSGTIDAQPYFQKGCDGGELRSCYELGRGFSLAHDRQIGPNDGSYREMSKKYYQKSCEMGHCLACEEIAQMYLEDVSNKRRELPKEQWKKEAQSDLNKANLAINKLCKTDTKDTRKNEIEMDIKQILYEINKK